MSNKSPKTAKKTKLSEQQIEQITSRCHTELLGSIAKDLKVDPRRVGETIKTLGIKRKRWAWGKYKKPYEALYNVLKAEAIRGTKIIPITLTFEEFMDFVKIKICHYCEADLVWAERIRHKEYVGTNLDRKDSLGPYSKDNCVACCVSCNRTKGDRFTYDEFILLAPTLRNIQRLRKEESNAGTPAVSV
jgi:hypothetical protein